VITGCSPVTAIVSPPTLKVERFPLKDGVNPPHGPVFSWSSSKPRLLWVSKIFEFLRKSYVTGNWRVKCATAWDASNAKVVSLVSILIIEQKSTKDLMLEGKKDG
jgi:hypothetical protein